MVIVMVGMIYHIIAFSVLIQTTVKNRKDPNIEKNWFEFFEF